MCFYDLDLLRELNLQQDTYWIGIAQDNLENSKTHPIFWVNGKKVEEFNWKSNNTIYCTCKPQRNEMHATTCIY